MHPLINNIETVNDYTSAISIGPLNPAMAKAIANPLRRILLSQISGYAITAISLPRVWYRYQDVGYLNCPLIVLLQRLKSLAVSLPDELDTPYHYSIQLQGPCLLTGANFNVAPISIANPDLILGQLTTSELINIDLIVERGAGYRVARVDTFSNHQKANMLQLSTIFNPINIVRYSFISTDDGNQNIRFVIESNGTVEPVKVMLTALNCFVQEINQLSQLNEPKPTEQIYTDDQPKPLIAEMGLGVRSYKCLVAANINTVQALLQYTPEDLLKMKNLGRVSLNEIISALKKKQLYLKGMDHESQPQ